MAYDVFICHSSSDKPVAMAICEELEKDDIKCWIAPRNVTGGKSYAREIVEAIKGFVVTIFVFSENSNASAHVENEIDTAFNAGKVIIPYRLDESDMNEFLQYYLNKKHWLDMGEDVEKSFADLKSMVISNLPRKAKDLELHNALETIKQSASSKSVDSDMIEELRKTFVALKDTIGGEDDGAVGECDIFKNKDGDVLMVINRYPGGPENPRLVCDGGTKAIFYRSKESAIVFRNISQDAMDYIITLDQITICEVEGEDVLREYIVPLKKIKSVEALARSVGVTL